MNVHSHPSPLVSVVIPIHNMEAFLQETLDWVMQSEFSSFEVILVDDGSRDGSMAIAEGFLSLHGDRVKLIKTENRGAAAARNAGIAAATGKYILPVDADDMITPKYMPEAVKILESQPDVKVVTAQAEFFGDKSGNWSLPEFDLALLARKNHIPAIAMYRKRDWLQTGGYCEQMQGREDWDFWIAMLKNGGDVHRLPFVGFKYRIRANSKRIRTRKLKSVINAQLNERHADFFKEVLGGPLRIQRTWSKPYNKLLKFFGLLK